MKKKLIVLLTALTLTVSGKNFIVFALNNPPVTYQLKIETSNKVEPLCVLTDEDTE